MLNVDFAAHMPRPPERPRHWKPEVKKNIFRAENSEPAECFDLARRTLQTLDCRSLLRRQKSLKVRLKLLFDAFERILCCLNPQISISDVDCRRILLAENGMQGLLLLFQILNGRFR